MTLVESIGYFSAALGIAMIAMKTMIPLRITGIAHNIGQIVFGLLAGVYPTVVQHCILLPLNTYRLFEMIRLVKKVKIAAAGDHSLEWLKPFTSRRTIRAGETLFRKSDEANAVYFVVTGSLKIQEINVDALPGAVVGELGMLAPDHKRTQTVICTEDAVILEISYEKIKELYYQNPEFGFYFLKLASSRLFDNIDRLQRTLAERDAEIKQLRSAA